MEIIQTLITKEQFQEVYSIDFNMGAAVLDRPNGKKDGTVDPLNTHGLGSNAG